MICEIDQKLQSLGIVNLPAPPLFANRLRIKRCENIIYISGHPSDLTGAVGADVTVEQAYGAALQTAIACLGSLRSVIQSFDEVESVDKITGFVRSAPHFVDQSRVVDGASDLIVKLFGENGMHSRSAIGVAQLPNGSSVEIEMIVRTKGQ